MSDLEDNVKSYVPKPIKYLLVAGAVAGAAICGAGMVNDDRTMSYFGAGMLVADSLYSFSLYFISPYISKMFGFDDSQEH